MDVRINICDLRHVIAERTVSSFSGLKSQIGYLLFI